MIVKAIVFLFAQLVILTFVGFIIIAWVRYPNCGEGRIAVYAGPETMTTWACVEGFSPEWRGRRCASGAIRCETE